MSPGSLPDPGWYLDSQSANTQRYWNGTQWTDHRLPLSLPPPTSAPVAWTPPPSPVPVQAVARQSTSSSGLELPAGSPVQPTQLASVGRRFGGYLLDYVLSLVTLGIGWMIWATVLAANGTGTTPGKQLLGLRCVDVRTGHTLGFGSMFVREVVGKLLFAFVVYVTFGLALPLMLWLLWDRSNQQLWDKLVSSVVVDDQRR